jgi:hypothetical protein
LQADLALAGGMPKSAFASALKMLAIAIEAAGSADPAVNHDLQADRGTAPFNGSTSEANEQNACSVILLLFPSLGGGTESALGGLTPASTLISPGRLRPAGMSQLPCPALAGAGKIVLSQHGTPSGGENFAQASLPTSQLFSSLPRCRKP